jgi:hypothetical protein
MCFFDEIKQHTKYSTALTLFNIQNIQGVGSIKRLGEGHLLPGAVWDIENGT